MSKSDRILTKTARLAAQEVRVPSAAHCAWEDLLRLASKKSELESGTEQLGILSMVLLAPFINAANRGKNMRPYRKLAL